MKGIIFDFDGPIYAGRKAAFGALDATYNQFAASIGRPRLSMANAPLFPPKQMIGAAYAEFELAPERLLEVREYYSAQLKEAERQLEVSRDVITLLDELRGRAFKLAILSGRTTANLTELLKHLGLAERFAGVWSKNVDADMVSLIADELQLQLTDLVLVGDSDTDYSAAEKAGIPYYHVGWSEEPASVAHARANAVATSVAELNTILQED
jgi:phosphoglycolate phosphatase-like HAD superfamily hydrolase